MKYSVFIGEDVGLPHWYAQVRLIRSDTNDLELSKVVNNCSKHRKSSLGKVTICDTSWVIYSAENKEDALSIEAEKKLMIAWEKLVRKAIRIEKEKIKRRNDNILIMEASLLAYRPNKIDKILEKL